MAEEPDILLFDGVCNLCNSAVLFVIKRDKRKRYRFASLQSSFAKSLLKSKAIPESQHLNSIVLIEKGKVYQRSDAALKVLRHMGGLYRLCIVFWLVPRFIRDAVYRYIARKRYLWFGKREECMVPSSDLKKYFIG